MGRVYPQSSQGKQNNSGLTHTWLLPKPGSPTTRTWGSHRVAISLFVLVPPNSPKISPACVMKEERKRKHIQGTIYVEKRRFGSCVQKDWCWYPAAVNNINCLGKQCRANSLGLPLFFKPSRNRTSWRRTMLTRKIFERNQPWIITTSSVECSTSSRQQVNLS